MATNISNERYINAVNERVSALPKLTDDERETVREIAVAAALKNGTNGKVNLDGIASLVRSQHFHQNNTTRSYPTPNTFKANGGRI
jgi:hypothetical protein